MSRYTNWGRQIPSILVGQHSTKYEGETLPRTRFQRMGFEERLPVQLIPKPTWGVNVRTILDHEDTWAALRHDAWTRHEIEDRASKPEFPPRYYVCCSGCNRKLRRGNEWHAHEVWEYDTATRIQKLIGIVPICPECHEAVHIGLAQVKGNGERARHRLKDVNLMSIEEVEDYLMRCFTLWEHQSKYEDWQVNIDWALDRIMKITEQEPDE